MSTYRADVAPALVEGVWAMDAALATIEADPTADAHQRAWRVRTEVIPLIQSQRTAAEQYVTSEEELMRVHAKAVAALAAMEETFWAYAYSLETGDTVAYEDTVSLDQHARSLWDQWRSDLQRLTTD